MEVIVISDDNYINRSDETSINHFPSLANVCRKSVTNSMSIKTYSRRDGEQVMSDKRADEECDEESVEWIDIFDTEVDDRAKRRVAKRKPYLCDWVGCGKRYASKYYVKEHQRKAHLKSSGNVLKTSVDEVIDPEDRPE